MTSKQDRQGVRTAADLEQKYHFGRMFQKLEEGIKAVAAKATEDLAKLKAYADGKFLEKNGVIPISGGGTGGKTVAEAQSALHVTQDFLFSQLTAAGNKSLSTITSYPTKAGVYRVGNASAVTDATLPGSWGNLIIFDTGYVVHIFINSSGMWFQRTDNTFVPKTTWNKVTTS